MFGKRTAWFTAVFLSAFHFHIHFSRIGLNNIWDGFWYVVTIGALWYGWEKDRRNAYILAGLSLGISQYFYSSSRTILALILAWVILAAILRSSPPETRLGKSRPDAACNHGGGSTLGLALY